MENIIEATMTDREYGMEYIGANGPSYVTRFVTLHCNRPNQMVNLNQIQKTLEHTSFKYVDMKIRPRDFYVSKNYTDQPNTYN